MEERPTQRNAETTFKCAGRSAIAEADELLLLLLLKLLAGLQNSSKPLMMMMRMTKIARMIIREREGGLQTRDEQRYVMIRMRWGKGRLVQVETKIIQDKKQLLADVVSGGMSLRASYVDVDR